MSEKGGNQLSYLSTGVLILVALFAGWSLLGLLTGEAESEQSRTKGVAEDLDDSDSQDRTARSQALGTGSRIEVRREQNEAAIDRPLGSPIPPGAEDLKRDVPAGSTTGDYRSDNYVLNFTGNENFTDEELRAALKLPETMATDGLEVQVRQQLTRFYKSHGFALARIKVSATDSHPIVADVEIKEGTVYVFGGLNVSGVSYFQISDVESMYPPVGEVVDATIFRQADARLRKAYDENGFVGAKVKGRTRPNRGRMFYDLEVEEGQRFRVDSLKLPESLEAGFPFARGEFFIPGVLDQFLSANNVSKRRVVVEEKPESFEVDITIFE